MSQSAEYPWSHDLRRIRGKLSMFLQIKTNPIYHFINCERKNLKVNIDSVQCIMSQKVNFLINIMLIRKIFQWSITR